MKTIFEYDESTGLIKDSNGVSIYMMGMIGFEGETEKPPVLDLVKQGLTTDDIVKLRNNDLI